MKSMNEALMSKAKEAKSAEELVSLAEENGVKLTKEEAEEYFAQLNKSGEISDEELDNVAGGGCQTKVGGEKYTVVTSGQRCFNGEFENNIEIRFSVNGDAVPVPVYTTDHMSLRGTWATFASDGCCGRCRHLKFKNGLGYCGKSAK